MSGYQNYGTNQNYQGYQPASQGVPQYGYQGQYPAAGNTGYPTQNTVPAGNQYGAPQYGAPQYGTNQYGGNQYPAPGQQGYLTAGQQPAYPMANNVDLYDVEQRRGQGFRLSRQGQIILGGAAIFCFILFIALLFL
eukprot:TRINITY_DN5932_c0_g3_i2.p2 TRINITY_DN5932_c0_g3~~TRINITY_DN5932_c0_g3_i2.p2  ORF type:complete len:136 (+),score=24.80 TRINITY_DN5932_c0_g3_i2:135-542(+)